MHTLHGSVRFLGALRTLWMSEMRKSTRAVRRNAKDKMNVPTRKIISIAFIRAHGLGSLAPQSSSPWQQWCPGRYIARALWSTESPLRAARKACTSHFAAGHYSNVSPLSGSDRRRAVFTKGACTTEKCRNETTEQEIVAPTVSSLMSEKVLYINKLQHTPRCSVCVARVGHLPDFQPSLEMVF